MGMGLGGDGQQGKVACIAAATFGSTTSTATAATGSSDLLFVLHDDATMHAWDVSSGTGRLIRSVGLLPEAQKAAFRPSCLAFSRDPLNRGVFMIASFEEVGTGVGDGGAEREVPTSIVALSEVTVRWGDQDRVEYMDVESGPQLPDVRGRMRSTSLEFVGEREYRLWMVMEGGEVRCGSYRGDNRGRHTNGQFAVETLDTRLRGLVSAKGVEREICKMCFSELARVCRMDGYALDTVCLPWNASRRAAAAAARLVVGMNHTDGLDGFDGFDGLDGFDGFDGLDVIDQRVQDWINGGSGDTDATDGGDGSNAPNVFDRSMDFMGAYADSFALLSSARSIKVIQSSQSSQSSSDRMVVLVRGDGRVSAMVDASAEEFLRYGNEACVSLAAATGPCTGTAALSLARYALCQGVSLRGTLLPVLVDVVTGKCHLNAVEFGRYHAAVRQAFRAFSVTTGAFFSGDAGHAVGAVEAIQASRQWSKESSSSQKVDHIDMAASERPSYADHDEVSVALAKAALEGCTRALLDLSLQLLIVGSSHNSPMTSIETYLRPFILSHWACTTAIVDDTGGKAEPMVVDAFDAPSASKRLKRSLAPYRHRHHAIDLAIACSENISKILANGGRTCRAGGAGRGTPVVSGVDALRSAVMEHFLSVQNTMRPFMHLLMRTKRISNKAELLDSLLRVIERGEDASFKFFTAYSLSRKTRDSAENRSLRLMERSRLEQEGLGMFLSLCDIEERDELAQCIASVTGKDAVLGMELTPERYIDAVAEIVDHLGCSSSAVRAGLFSAKIQESAGHHSEAASRARARVFKALEEEHNMQEAYTVALSVSDPQREQDCLNSLIASLCAENNLEVLTTLPLVGLLDDGGIHVLEHVTYALWDRAHKEPVDEATTYFVLYDFFVSRGNFQSAAGALLSFARRITAESERDELRKLLDLQKILTMTVGCLKLVRESDAWLEDSNIDLDIKLRRTENGQTEYRVPTVITVREVEEELLLVKSLLKIVSLDPDFDVQNASHHDVLVGLLQGGFYSEAWSLATILPYNDIQSSKELIVFKMSKDAFEQGLGATTGTSDLSTRIQSLVAGEPLAVADRLRLAAAEAILETDSNTSLPPWLIEPYLSKYENLSSQSKPSTSKADVAGMIRLLMHYGRHIDAGVLALQMLDPLVTSLPSIAFPRMGARCLPHDLIDELMASLRASTTPDDDEARLLLGRLETTTRQCVVSSSGQSAVLEGST